MKSDTHIKVRLTKEEKLKIEARAGAYFNGNISEFVRYCCLNFKKKK